MKNKLLCCLLLSAFAYGARAEFFKTNDELTEVQSGLKETSQNLQRIQLQKSELNTQLGEVEILYGRTAALLRTLQRQVELKRQNLVRIRQEMQGLQGEVIKQNKELAGQMKAAYAMGQKGKAKDVA